MKLMNEIKRIQNLMLITESEMVYSDEMRPKHKVRIENIPNSYFKDYNYEHFKNLNYPENESEEAVKELETLAQIDVDDSFVEDMDNVYKTFKKFLKTKDLTLNKKEVKELLDKSGAVVLDLKYHYNRPRPFQLNKIHKVDMDKKMMDSMKSPSFPSGHAAQGLLLGKILVDKYPEYESELLDIADDISYSRNMAKAHFPSDTKVGKELAEDMFNYLKDSGLLDSIKNKL